MSTKTTSLVFILPMKYGMIFSIHVDKFGLGFICSSEPMFAFDFVNLSFLIAPMTYIEEITTD